MAISRPTIVDDDLTGTTGTVADAAWVADFCDRIDAQLLGGCTPREQTTTATGAQNNFNLSYRHTYLRCTGAAPIFSGFTVAGAAPQQGDTVFIACVGTTAKVTHQDTGSTAANRIITPSTAGQIVGADGVIVLSYDATTARWRMVSVEPGDPIDVTFAAGNYTGDASMTWTVASSDSEVFRYQQRGRTVRVEVMVFTSTVGGTPSTTLRVAMPGGFTPSVNATSRSAFVAAYISDNGTEGIGRTNFSATNIEFVKVPSANWAAATDTTRVAFNGDVTVD